jgi:hypothetical protein
VTHSGAGDTKDAEYSDFLGHEMGLAAYTPPSHAFGLEPGPAAAKDSFVLRARQEGRGALEPDLKLVDRPRWA